MIQLDKTTREQQLWIPRSSKGSGDVRKSYKDGYKDGFDEGLRSSKIKLYDGMKLSYSKIYNLDDFDFSEVRKGDNLFESSSFYGKDYYDFTDLVKQMTDNCTDIFMHSHFYGDKEEYPTVRIELYRDIMRRIAYFSFYDSIVYIYQNYDVTNMNEYFSSPLCKELHLYLNTSSCTAFSNLFYNMRNDIYISGLDMSNEKNKNETIFNYQSERIDNIYLDDNSVPRTTLERLMDAYRKDTGRYTTIVFHYGKERWTWDAENNRWKITGYDE